MGGDFFAKFQCARLVQILTKHSLERVGWIGRLEHQGIEFFEGIFERGWFATPPGCHRGQLQFLASELLGQARQKAQERARLEHPRAKRVGDQHIAAPRAFGQAGDAQSRIGAQFNRVAKVVVLAAQDRVHAFEAVNGFQPDLAVTHRQIAAFDQRKAQIARKESVLEVGFVIRAGCEQYRQPGAITLRRKLCERIAQGSEKTRQMLNV